MRRRGGLVVAVILLAAACTAGEPAAVDRSLAPSGPTLPGAEHVDTADGAAIPESPPETVMDLGIELADDAVVDPSEADASSAANSAAATQDPRAVLLDPVPMGARAAVQPTSVSPAGPTSTGHIEIPAIGVSHPTYQGISLSIIDHGPSHWPGTARPGHVGNTVFPGHRTTHSRPFYDLDKLVPGDSVIFTTNEGRFTYRVSRIFVVDDEDTWIVKPTKNATFTIFACHPKGSARQRIVAVGELVSAPATPPTTAAPATTTTRPTTTTTARPSLLDILFG